MNLLYVTFMWRSSGSPRMTVVTVRNFGVFGRHDCKQCEVFFLLNRKTHANYDLDVGL